MKRDSNAKSVGLIAVLVLIGVGILWWPIGSNNSGSRRSEPQTESGLRDQPSRSLGQQSIFREPEPTKVDESKRTQAVQADRGEPIAVMKIAVAEKNAPINFWGKVTDQNDLPIPDVRIILRVRQWFYDPIKGTQSRFPRAETKSDSNGRFHLKEQSGDVLTLDSIEKEGYVLSPGFTNSLRFQNPVDSNLPTEQAPLVIKMWKIGAKGSTVNHRGFFGVVPDGRSLSIDLLLNQKSDGTTRSGDIQLKLARPKEINGDGPYRWQFEVAGSGGGIIEARDEFMYTAPENGYETNLVFDMDPSSPDWTSVLKKNFYFKSRGGTTFGVAKMTIRPDYNGGAAVQIESVINTNSSRNLQP